MQSLTSALVFAMLTTLFGCDTAYYGAMEKVGVHKRDILRDPVEEAMDSQEEAKQEFRSALEQFEAVVGIQPGGLKDAYTELQGTYDDAESRAKEVSDRIAAVEDVSGDLFAEWQREIDMITNAKLKAGSRKQLQSSQTAYRGFISAMRQAESSMQPVLTAFRDQVLYLKHNLNAQAIASLKGELSTIEADVGRLIRDMVESIRLSQAFLNQLPAIEG